MRSGRAVRRVETALADLNQEVRTATQASIDELGQRGGRIQLSECGDAGQRKRLCVRVDAKAGRFGDARRGQVYMIAEGY